MTQDIIIGRTESEIKELGKKATISIGKQYVKMGEITSLSNNVYLDVNNAHTILISGKRGSGKSFTLGVIAEEISNLPPEIKERLSVLIFDTMGIFWTMKYPNQKEEDLLKKWNISPRGLNVDIYTPKGYFNEYIDKGIPTDYSFALKPSELTAGDWCNVFNVEITSVIGVLIERIIEQLKDLEKEYSIEDIISNIQSDKRSDQTARDAAENRFRAALTWGLFDKDSVPIKKIVGKGKVSIIDISCYKEISGSWGIKSLVIGLISKKLLEERMTFRKEEELADIQTRSKLFEEERKLEMPLVWVLIDEAHEFLPRRGKTPATDSLVQLIREGRQPGISMILATQQPGEIHKDVITQADIVISHRLTAKPDIEALNSMMQSYLISDLQKSLNNLPRLAGSAILLDDNSERLYPIRIRPRFTWHGGEAPHAIKTKKPFGFEV
ncbi:MAG: ATP-binding protein [Candidatus Nanoarchaeia archaeon]|nr:ATP-binding protein [Candidatus Nanoarchaeia archaeon]